MALITPGCWLCATIEGEKRGSSTGRAEGYTMGDLLQPWHLILLAIVAFLLFGAKRLPELGKGLGEGLKGFREGIKGVTDPAPPTTQQSTQTPPPPHPQAASPQSRLRSEAVCAWSEHSSFEKGLCRVARAFLFMRFSGQALSSATAASASPIPATCRFVGRSRRMIPASRMVPAGYKEQMTAATSRRPSCEASM